MNDDELRREHRRERGMTDGGKWAWFCHEDDEEWPCTTIRDLDSGADLAARSEPRAEGLRDAETLRAVLEDGIKSLGGTNRTDLARALDDLVHLAATPPAPALDVERLTDAMYVARLNGRIYDGITNHDEARVYAAEYAALAPEQPE